MSSSEATTRCEQRAMGAEMDIFTGKFPWTGRVKSSDEGVIPAEGCGGGQSEAEG